MLRYFLARILALIPILIMIAVVAFVLLRLIPGDPASAMLPDEATIEEIESMRKQLGYYDPMYVQFFRYVETIATFNFGDSLFFRIPVTEVISMKLEATFLLALYSQILAIIVGIPVGYMFWWATKFSYEHFGFTWNIRMIGFGIGTIVFGLCSYLFLKEIPTLKTVICLLLALSIILIQVTNVIK